ncbi:hypothetical protein CKAN_01037600 [Cinnamomum micranthum f. kanehirae]|uniref:Uncharacterized protein n=1 Tax=Cinnamomum micranthum f. kanehirae TaxID=337451 RepID=A0A3S3NKP7_9MAGN|nr:hypothetical protein CKAN_01037600 [Cinnamomum micranthum f. kanehirae]
MPDRDLSPWIRDDSRASFAGSGTPRGPAPELDGNPATEPKEKPLAASMTRSGLGTEDGVAEYYQQHGGKCWRIHEMDTLADRGFSFWMSKVRMYCIFLFIFGLYMMVLKSRLVDSFFIVQVNLELI